MIQPGTYDGAVVRTSLGATRGGTSYAAIRVQPTDNGTPLEEIVATIWLTEKSMKMARAALKKCGFDPDTKSLRELQDHPHALANNPVQIEVEEDDRGQIRANIALGKMTDSKIEELTEAIRRAKKDGESPVAVREAEPAEPAENIPF